MKKNSLTNTQMSLLALSTGTKYTFDQMGLGPDGVIKSQNLDDKDNIEKSGTIGYDVNPTGGMRDGLSALRFEYLDSRLFNLSYNQGQFIFYGKLAGSKMSVSNNVYQYALFDRHGAIGPDLVNAEGEVSAPSDPSTHRETAYLKYLSSTYNITIPTLLVDAVENAAQVYQEDALAKVAATIEWEAFYGDSDMTSGGVGKGQGLEFDGLAKLIAANAPQNVIDEKGAALSPKMIQDASSVIYKGSYWKATDVYMPVEVKSDFIAQLPPQVPLSQTAPGTNYSVGYTSSVVNTPWGPVALNDSATMTNNMFFDDTEAPTLGDGLKPVVTPTETKTDKGEFKDEDVSTLNYKVVSQGRSHKSPAADVAIALTAKDSSISLAIKVPGIAQAKIDFVSVYRQDAKSGLFFLVARIGANQADGTGTITFVDRNQTIPCTFDVFVGNMDPMTIQLLELLPVVSMPLAQINASITRSVLWYGGLALRRPRAWVHLKNVGGFAIAPQR